MGQSFLLRGRSISPCGSRRLSECPAERVRELVEQVTTYYNGLEPVDAASLVPDDKGQHAAEEV